MNNNNTSSFRIALPIEKAEWKKPFRNALDKSERGLMKCLTFLRSMKRKVERMSSEQLGSIFQKICSLDRN
jgi:hypothetical protein